MALTVHTTPACRYCGETTNIVVDRDGLAALKAGAHPAEAFPVMFLAERTLVAEGTHAECATKALRYALADHAGWDGGIDE
jgi:hypothetical protein